MNLIIQVKLLLLSNIVCLMFATLFFKRMFHVHKTHYFVSDFDQAGCFGPGKKRCLPILYFVIDVDPRASLLLVTIHAKKPKPFLC